MNIPDSCASCMDALETDECDDRASEAGARVGEALERSRRSASRPHHHPKTTSEAMQDFLVEARKAHPRWGPASWGMAVGSVSWSAISERQLHQRGAQATAARLLMSALASCLPIADSGLSISVRSCSADSTKPESTMDCARQGASFAVMTIIDPSAYRSPSLHPKSYCFRAATTRRYPLRGAPRGAFLRCDDKHRTSGAALPSVRDVLGQKCPAYSWLNICPLSAVRRLLKRTIDIDVLSRPRWGHPGGPHRSVELGGQRLTASSYDGRVGSQMQLLVVGPLCGSKALGPIGSWRCSMDGAGCHSRTMFTPG